MNSMIKKAAVGATLIAAVALVATPSQARWNRGEAAAAGFVAGAAVGAVATNSYYGQRSYGQSYGSGYYGRSGYYGGSGYYGRSAYYGGSGYYGGGAYAYQPAYSERAYGGPAYAAQGGCWVTTDDARGYGYYGACTRFRETPEARQKKIPN